MKTKSFKRKTKKSFYQSRYKRSSSGKRNFATKINPNKFINKAIKNQKDEDYKAKNNFADFKINQQLIKNVLNKGYKKPTPIQDQIIPYVLENKDVVGIADTGTGKTVAFLLPLINKLSNNSKEKALIITPTRELAMQINLEFRKIVGGMSVFSVCCVGGMNIGKQISKLRRGPSLVIGTPGRLKDLIERKIIDLRLFNSVVLDESDRILDMGFIKDTRFIINKMPQEKQVLLFSATASSKIETIIREFTKKAIRISIKTRDTSKNVDQDVIRIQSGKNKMNVLSELLNKKEFNKVLVFGRTRVGVERISKTLIVKGFQAESIHGDKNNFQRQKALKSFQKNKVQVLVATDVAARGLNLFRVSHVINYDIPATYQDYIHRIGRTGRWNQQGVALTFID